MHRHLRNSFFLLEDLSKHQEYFLGLFSMLAGLCVGIKENIHVVALDAAAAVLRGVDDPADHDVASVRNYARVHGNGASGGCDGTGAGVAAPALRALSAWTVAGGAEEAEGF